MNDINKHINKVNKRRINDKYLPYYVKDQWKINNFRNNYKEFIRKKSMNLN